eukprot:928819-Prymnesium_polylepis.1
MISRRRRRPLLVQGCPHAAACRLPRRRARRRPAAPAARRPRRPRHQLERCRVGAAQHAAVAVAAARR